MDAMGWMGWDGSAAVRMSQEEELQRLPTEDPLQERRLGGAARARTCTHSHECMPI